MKVTRDEQADVLYIRFNDRVIHTTKAVGNGLVAVDLTDDGTVVGIELISPSLYVQNLEQMDYETTEVQESYFTIQEMAEMHGVTPHTLHRILRADQGKPESERRIPGAYKVGDEWRGEWRIPRDSAKAWQRSPKGRKMPSRTD